MILALESYGAERGCVILQPYPSEVGAGTFNPATFLRALGPEPWRVGYVEPSRRPKDGRYGENPVRFQQFYQYQVLLKPTPDDVVDQYFDSLRALGIEPRDHDLRLIEDEAAKGKGTIISLHASTEAAVYLLNAKRADLAAIEDLYGVRVEVLPEGEEEGAKMRVQSSGPRPAEAPRFEPIVHEHEDEELEDEDEDEDEDEEASADDEDDDEDEDEDEDEDGEDDDEDEDEEPDDEEGADEVSDDWAGGVLVPNKRVKSPASRGIDDGPWNAGGGAGLRSCASTEGFAA